MKAVLREVTILADIALLGWDVYLAFSQGFNVVSDAVIFFGILVFVSLNLYFVIAQSERVGWVGLFLKRKALEEEQKIKNLQS